MFFKVFSDKIVLPKFLVDWRLHEKNSNTGWCTVIINNDFDK